MRQYQSNYYDEYEEERPKHRKVATSGKTKKKKADHKHNYKECTLKYIGEDENRKLHTLYSPAKYCTVCGKLECRLMNYTNTTMVNMAVPVLETEMWANKVAL